MSARVVQGAFAAVTAALLSSAPTIAQACSVCLTGREDDNRIAFLTTTVFLSVLPLAILGGVVYWVWRRARDESHRGAQPAASCSQDTSVSADFAARSVSAGS